MICYNDFVRVKLSFPFFRENVRIRRSTSLTHVLSNGNWQSFHRPATFTQPDNPVLHPGLISNRKTNVLDLYKTSGMCTSGYINKHRRYSKHPPPPLRQ